MVKTGFLQQVDFACQEALKSLKICPGGSGTKSRARALVPKTPGDATCSRVPKAAQGGEWHVSRHLRKETRMSRGVFPAVTREARIGRVSQTVTWMRPYKLDAVDGFPGTKSAMAKNRLP